MSRTSYRRTVFSSALALAAMILLLPSTQTMAATYEIEFRGYDGGNLVCGPLSFFESEPDPVSGTFSHQAVDVVGNSSATYDALAGMGYVGMKNDVSHRVNLGFGRIFGGCNKVRMVIDDLQVVGPPGQITASLNADLLARIEIDTLSTRSHLKVTVTLRSTQGGPAASNTVDIDLSETADIDQIINSGPLTFNVGDVLEAELEIDMHLVAGPSPDGLTVVNVFDFLDENEGYGLSLSRTEVLTLPAGYTANSADGDVGDNQWGGTVPTSNSTWGDVKSMYR